MKRAKVLFFVTDPFTARTLMRGQLRRVGEAGFDVALACAPGTDLESVARAEGCEVHTVPFAREIAPLLDLRALALTSALIRRLEPAIVNAGTPKAGLLGMLAARLQRVPARIYTLRGLRLETASGARRKVLSISERLAMRAAHRIVCVSESLRQRAIELGLAPPAKTVVLGNGSSNGVDVERFHPRNRDNQTAGAKRRELGIPEEAPVVGFVGRLTRDKGVSDLVMLFERQVRPRLPDARLLLVGDFENGDPLPPEICERIESSSAIIKTGIVDEPASLYAIMHVLAFPSLREGLPNVPLEAAASGLPVAGYAAVGTVDAVAHGETGTLVECGKVEALGEAIVAYLHDRALRDRHGLAGRERAVALFRRELVWQAWEEEYRRLLSPQ